MTSPDHLSTGDAPLAETTVAVTAVHVPGAPLVTQADADAQVDDLLLASDGALHVAEYNGVDTTHPEANYDSRSNVVRP